MFNGTNEGGSSSNYNDQMSVSNNYTLIYEFEFQSLTKF